MNLNAVFLTTMMLLPALFLGAQNRLPVIKAKSDTVDIRDGKELKKKVWTITPTAMPDVCICIL